MNPKKMNKEQLIAEVNSLRETVSAQQNRIDNLTVQAKEADELNEEKASAIDNLKDVIDKLNADVQEKANCIANLKVDIKSKVDDNLGLTKELQDARKQVTAICNDAQGMESRIAELTAINSKPNIWKPIALGAIIAFLIALAVIIA